jgi:hypothetical protein
MSKVPALLSVAEMARPPPWPSAFSEMMCPGPALISVPLLVICEVRSLRVESRRMVPLLTVPSATATVVLKLAFVSRVTVVFCGNAPLKAPPVPNMVKLAPLVLGAEPLSVLLTMVTGPVVAPPLQFTVVDVVVSEPGTFTVPPLKFHVLLFTANAPLAFTVPSSPKGASPRNGAMQLCCNPLRLLALGASAARS